MYNFIALTCNEEREREKTNFIGRFSAFELPSYFQLSPADIFYFHISVNLETLFLTIDSETSLTQGQLIMEYDHQILSNFQNEFFWKWGLLIEFTMASSW